MRSIHYRQIALAILFCGCLSGCNTEPALHPISGHITLGGKPYERLIVYFRPLDDAVTKYNLGVGETDAKGDLSLRSTAGPGLAAGTYKVSFTCIVSRGGKVIGSTDEKQDDDRSLVTEELVPPAYAEGGISGLEFEVQSSAENRFEFDIPAKTS
ncbi:putative secreted protein [Rhodopirellula maiorica SM1]|uniref:Putative secreted protein n=1 Tax=Rhodopirellula maiorica SM1 TaxID=1265738 RepID=M5RPD9_9BACT|nr:hypothetical protein [Rhodopirellula maiorica]EMI17252.1 putative secreted protein [Rhodopirellula maiorica SM1]